MSLKPEGMSSILSISSHVIRGSVGNRASTFVFESFGYSVWEMPTIIIPWHPGVGPSHPLIISDEAFTRQIDDILSAEHRSEISVIFTGYFASERQVTETARLIRTLASENPKISYLCDPVFGDAGELYIKPEVAEAVRNELIPIS